jgi:hypothetical protein
MLESAAIKDVDDEMPEGETFKYKKRKGQFIQGRLLARHGLECNLRFDMGNFEAFNTVRVQSSTTIRKDTIGHGE